jgi:hypothetical protein
MAETQKAPAKAGATSGSPFDALTLDESKKLVEDSIPAEAHTSAKFIAGDHWQNGDGWVGPVPDLDDPDYGITLSLIKQAFTSRNVIKEIVNRHMRGVIGEEPTIGVAPRVPLKAGEKMEDAQVERKRELEAAITEWWDSRGAHLTIQKAVARSCWAGRSSLRLYVPRGKVLTGVIPTQPDITSALSLVYLDAPDPLLSTVHVDEDTKDQIGVLLTEVGGDLRVELTYLGPSTSTIENDPKNPRPTIIRTIDKDADTQFLVAIGGRITMYVIERELIITEQQHQMQKALNLCQSMIPRTVVTGGFLERIILNALPPGHWLTDAKGKKIQFVRTTWQTGPGTTQWVRGIELPQKDGSVQLTTPSVTLREPSDTKPADDGKRALYQDMLEEADQAHILMNGDANASGKSRQEGRSDYEVSLTQTEAPTNGAGRWVIETILAMAEQFMMKPGTILNDWRGQFECRVNSGRVTFEERQQILRERDAGLISNETAMSQIGVLDVQGEMDRMSAEQGGFDLALLKRQAEILALLGTAGATIDGAAELVGIAAADAAKLFGGDTTGGGANDPNNPPIDGGPPIPSNGNGKVPPAPAPVPAGR